MALPSTSRWWTGFLLWLKPSMVYFYFASHYALKPFHFYLLLFLADITMNLPNELQLIMWRISNIVGILLLSLLTSSSYLEFPLERSIIDRQSYEHDPIVCKNETTLNQDAEYHQICYEKDISYTIPFMNNDQHVFMSVDLTIPISWLKAPQCKIQGAGRSCRWKTETFAEKVKETKKKISNKLHKKKEELTQNAIIQGSSSIIRGEIQKSKNLTFIAKDSSRLDNFFELIMLGLFIYGEKDVLQLINTNFINATEISQNLDTLSDGAISLRFDPNSQNSFLNQIFTYVKAAQKTVTIYIGANHTITIGDMTAKYTENGYSSIEWIDMTDDQGYGKLPKLKDIGMQDREEDTEGEVAEQLTAVFTLSASYIGLPESAITSVFSKFMTKEVNCSVNSKTYFIECTASNKKKFQKLKQKSLFFSFDDKNINVKMQKLVLSEQSKKIVLNIKKTYNNRVILGQPIFIQHFIALDYSKNKIGFAPKRVEFQESFISIVVLVRFLCFLFVLGIGFVFFGRPCNKMLKGLLEKDWRKTAEGLEGRRLKQYSPIQENPYQDLKGKIQEVLGSEKEVGET